MGGSIDIKTDLKSFRLPAKAKTRFFPKGRLFQGRYLIGRFYRPGYCYEELISRISK
jgi:hypothetical protein